MKRRIFVFAGCAAAAAVAPARGATGIEVIYVGGLDCAPCTTWKNRHRAAWLASAEYRQVTWVEIEPTRLREAYHARHWPAGLHAVLDGLPRKSGTPRFLIVKDGAVVSNEFGVSKWAVTLADLRKLLGE